MDPQKLPLEPLIAPPPVSWWPLAPIWWIGIAILLTVFTILLIYLFRHKFLRQQPKPPVIDIDVRRQAALKELKSFEKPYQKPTEEWLQQINALLKRLCITHYANEKIQTLTGQPWLNFLDSKCPQAHIKQFPMLVDNAYQANYCMDNQTIDNLYSSIETWITHHV
ncbi:DUF4381 domain-containing protein [Entomomonas moraniae]|uniref:DUF4381 domain-containing protein n=1 Tax=Entomomonas moraniae TaxID=2213226 RepID=A0A3S9XEM4_9GAMM|nr:DUF4381 domain-containing protein [Entomomonas moraniae]AZS50851.1 DUF4381 domain-containing protein [Entomomonas moraniae]